VSGRPTGRLQDLVDLGRRPSEEAAGAAAEQQAAGPDGVPPTVARIRSEDFHDQVARALPDGLSATRFIRVCETAMLERPNFLLVPPKTLDAALLRCAALGLEPNSPLGHIFLEPELVGETGAWTVNTQMGYKGMLQLIHRTPSIEYVRVAAIRERDQWDYDQGTEAFIMHKQALADRGEPVVYYVIWKRAGVQRADFELVTIDEIEERKSFNLLADLEDSAWQTNRDLMERKTALKIAFTFMPVDASVAAAVADLDQAPALAGEAEPAAEPEAEPAAAP